MNESKLIGVGGKSLGPTAFGKKLPTDVVERLLLEKGEVEVNGILGFMLEEILKHRNVTIKVKKLSEHAKIPRYAQPGDAAMDLYAVEHSHIYLKDSAGARALAFVQYDIGLAIEIPMGYVGLLFPRSSISKTRYSLANCVGVIDSGYRGPIKISFRKGQVGDLYDKGDRIGQLMIVPLPKMKMEEVKELSASFRGDGGFGSTGH